MYQIVKLLNKTLESVILAVNSWRSLQLKCTKSS